MSRFLFVISLNWKQNLIGGHMLSAISLCRHLEKSGHEVGLASALSFSLPEELGQSDLTLHFAPYPGLLSRPVTLSTIVRDYGYDVIVTMDVVAAWQVALPAIRFGVPIIQVIPGGPVPRFPIIPYPGIVVFSEELYKGIPSRQNIPQEYLTQSAGRVDFTFFEDKSQDEPEHDLDFSGTGPRILVVSRLHFGKHEAIRRLFEQITDVTTERKAQLVVVGDGEARAILEREADAIVTASNGNAHIAFAGGFRITPADLRQADVVVGQGRTVVEALASGVSAAVCGNEGYFGLLTTETFPALSQTNMTGRDVQSEETLRRDLERLEQYRREDFEEVRQLAFDYYDVSHGSKAIASAFTRLVTDLPSRGSRRRLAISAYARAAANLLRWGVSFVLRRLRRR